MNPSTNPAETLSRLAGYVNAELANLSTPREMGTLDTIARYALDGGGKRLRPVLTLATCMALNPDATERTALWQALGVEIFHNFTLVHDDVMDRSDTRRGRPSVWAERGEAMAILGGDAMLTLAEMTVMHDAGEHLRAVLEAFHAGSMEVYAGQELDMAFEDRADVTTSEYLRMIMLKTAALLRCAVTLGAIMADASTEATEAMRAYAIGLGMAFQLRDDYLDTYGDAATFGKPIGGDIANGKKTWLLTEALASEAAPRIEAIYADSSLSRQERFDAVKAIYDELELPDKLNKLVKQYSDMAILALEDAAMPAPWQEFFTHLARSAESREK
ncbi:MAG: polyprenyl synthetase family protein [Candidatus Amulumruptor caecigallinarius]|nr:polyprenyl synthetase family protein [Candidatus Amulumruptor caecigallinarius]MCM1397368.1 polyprenyl synthetase family protein [Candidatus Amulumruptor caecigallinarius]MCM1454736.1 polyprenyl synthetase family protein [bacterium]